MVVVLVLVVMLMVLLTMPEPLILDIARAALALLRRRLRALGAVRGVRACVVTVRIYRTSTWGTIGKAKKEEGPTMPQPELLQLRRPPAESDQF
jgi:hypothetical protein